VALPHGNGPTIVELMPAGVTSVVLSVVGFKTVSDPVPQANPNPVLTVPPTTMVGW